MESKALLNEQYLNNNVLRFEKTKRVLSKEETAILKDLIEHAKGKWKASNGYAATGVKNEFDKGVALGMEMASFSFLEYIKTQYGIEYL